MREDKESERIMTANAMQKVITVRGTADVKVKPDYVNILVDLETRDAEYRVGMEEAARRIEALKAALKSVGVDPEDLRTADFGVDTEWDWTKERNGDYKDHVFRGYKIRQKLKFGFDFERDRMVTILSAVASSGVDPEFRVQFTVKDKSAVKEELFAKASENARKIAEGLCRGVGKRLGDIININYSWQEIDIYHEINGGCNRGIADCAAPDINPEDLDASDSVTFTWELV